ncbi:MAG: HAMP domain-containing protein [Actinobacteria bacterium]|nr:HAMP domain-containing protein [Actinomycetota bacterium]
MAAVLAALSVLVYVRVGNALLSSVDQTLRAQAHEALTHKPNERGIVDPDASGGTTLAEVLDANGSTIRSTPARLAPLLDASSAAHVAAGATLHRTVTIRRFAGTWRLIAVRSSRDRSVVVLARSLSSRDETLDRLLRELLIASPLALLVASLAGYGLAAAALRPVEAMRRRAAAITAVSPTLLPVPRANDEISRLAITLNDMLTRLRASFEHERRFVADASHELRTPLALLRTELELALRRPRTPAELEAALRSAAEETVRLSRLADDLLLIARAEQGTLPIRPRELEVDTLLAEVAARFHSRAEQLGRTISATTTGEIVRADGDRLDQALSNLVENALAHGGGDVRLHTVSRDGVLELHVTDGGPGFPAAFLDRAFDRFSRADNARGRGGAGLGLSIVGLIAEAHGGRAVAANGGNGTDVWLELPVQA